MRTKGVANFTIKWWQDLEAVKWDKWLIYETLYQRAKEKSHTVKRDGAIQSLIRGPNSLIKGSLYYYGPLKA